MYFGRKIKNYFETYNTDLSNTFTNGLLSLTPSLMRLPFLHLSIFVTSFCLDPRDLSLALKSMFLFSLLHDLHVNVTNPCSWSSIQLPSRLLPSAEYLKHKHEIYKRNEIEATLRSGCLQSISILTPNSQFRIFYHPWRILNTYPRWCTCKVYFSILVLIGQDS